MDLHIRGDEAMTYLQQQKKQKEKTVQEKKFNNIFKILPNIMTSIGTMG